MRRLSLCTMTALVLSGCGNFDEQDTYLTNNINQPQKLYASIEEPAIDSRTYIDTDNKLRWSSGDEISYFPGVNYNMQYRFCGETGERGGNFEKVTTGSVNGVALTCNYAVYPYVEDTSISDSGVISFNLPAIQQYAEHSFGLGANVMIAATESVTDETLSFKNACGYLKLQLYGENTTVKSIALKGNNDEKIAGAATITTTHGGNPVVGMTESAITSITLDCDEGVKLSTDSVTPTTFWFVIPEQAFERGFSIKVTDTRGYQFEKSTPNPVAILRNTIQPMKAVKVECKNLAPESWKIYYTSKDGATVTPYATEVFGANIVSNIYENGMGVITFDAPVTSIGNNAFYNCNGLTSITIPDSVKTIGDTAFRDCFSLTSVTIPNSVTKIGNYAFDKCKSLTSVTIGNGVTSIGYCAFRDCISLASITIPDGVTSIRGEAFYRCTSMKEVYCKPTTPPTGGLYMFSYFGNSSYVPIGCKIYVPASADDSIINAYKTKEYWSDYASYIEEYDFSAEI